MLHSAYYHKSASEDSKISVVIRIRCSLHKRRKSG